MRPLYSVKKPRFYHETYSIIEDFVSGEVVFNGKLHIYDTHIRGSVRHWFNKRSPLCYSYRLKTSDFVGIIYLETLEIKDQYTCQIVGICPIKSRQYHSVLYKDNIPVFKIEHIEPFNTYLKIYGSFTERLAVNWLVDYRDYTYKIKEKGENWLKIKRKF